MDRQQLEMSFEQSGGFRPMIRRHRRATRARWWFQQMRQVVDRAWDWEPAAPERCEPTGQPLPNGHERN